MPSPKLPLRSELTPSVNRFVQDHLAPQAKAVSRIAYTFTAANAEVRIRHRLGHVPQGYRVIVQDRAGSVYRAGDATKSTRQFISLKSSVAGLTVSLEVF